MIICPTYTPKEAEQKFCPLNWIANRQEGGIKLINCINVRCMMWRWEDLNQEEGFCGLAGKSWE